VQGEVSAPGLGTRNEYTGHARIDNFAPREVLTRFGLAVPQTSDTAALRRASLDTNFEVTPTRAAFDDLVVGLDDSRITGSFLVEEFSDPRYRFALSADKLNADRYLPPQAEEAGGDERRAGDLELSNEALSAIRIDGSVRVGELRLAGLDFQNVNTSMIVGNGSMHLDGAHANLYGGVFDGRFHVDTDGDLPTMLLSGKTTGLQLAPLIVALMGDANFSGTADFDIDLQGRGTTVTDNLHAAAGTMGFALTNGAIEGFNIDNTLCRTFNRARQQPMPPEQPNRTPYESIRGTATVTDGIANSDDLFGRAGSAEVRGKGTLALAEQITNYRFEVRLAHSVPIQGCQDMDRIVGLDFPLVMTGPVDAPEITPDYGQVLQRIIEDKVRDDIQERIQDRLLDRILR
jgi:AsmA protein